MDGTIGFALLFCVGTNYHFLLSNRLLSRRHAFKGGGWDEWFSLILRPPQPYQISTGPNAFRERKKKKRGREGKTRMSHLSWKKNRDTGGVTCMESYVGNTPPNERFSLWDVCFMCFFGAAAKRYLLNISCKVRPYFTILFVYHWNSAVHPIELIIDLGLYMSRLINKFVDLVT